MFFFSLRRTFFTAPARARGGMLDHPARHESALAALCLALRASAHRAVRCAPHSLALATMLAHFLPAFFLPAMVFFGPLRVRALVLVRCPWTGSPRRCRIPC